MALTYNKNIRDLSIKGTITLNTGAQIYLTADDIITYSFDSQIGSEGLPLGSAESANFSLEISNVGRKYTPAQFDNAEVHMFVGIKTGADYVYSDFGVWYVESSSAPEQSVSISLSGYDALATRFEAEFEDDKSDYPCTIGDIVNIACLAAGIKLKTASFPNAALTVSNMPKWEDGTTLRDVLSFCAVCAGGYVRIARNGQLEIVGFGDGQTYELDPDMYQEFTLNGGTAFKFNAIEAMLKDDAEEYTRYAVDGDISDNATNTIQVEYNPLLTDLIMKRVVSELTGIEMDAGSLTWCGDPSVQCTDYINVTMLNGEQHKIMVTSQSFTFDGGLSATENCDLPAINSVSSPTYSTSTNMYDARGNLKATRISGLSTKVISATSAHFNSLTTDTAEIDVLTSSLIHAVNLLAGKIDAKTLKAESVTAAQIAAGAITADKIKAGAIDADAIKAVVAEIGNITASNILTNTLGAALAKIAVLSAGTATFDRATVEHLVANLFNLTGSAVMEDVFIHNLKIAYAQMVSASIGNLVLQSSDGKYYQIDVSQSGQVTASQVYPSAAEEENGVFGETRPIIATQMTVDEMNASTIKAVSMLVNKIDAAKIDTDELFAREAFITKLKTSKIVGDKSLILISQSADEAKAAAEQAKTTADTANDNAASAQTAAENAATAASDAAEAASAANTSASSAASDASAAKTAATNAQGSASTASAAASNAATSASDAKKAADNASAVANEAKTDAKTATDIANAAKATADTASNNAEDALRDATNAGTLAQEAVDKIGDIPTYVEIPEDGSGVYIKDIQEQSVVKINSGSVSIGAVSGAAKGYSQLTANYVQFGNYQLRKSGDGGLVFKLAEG